MDNVNLLGVRPRILTFLYIWYLYNFTFSFKINLDTRKGAIIFNKPKAVRLAFHDCMPYEDGGGCDGCLNFEANEDEHNVLQHSVAILVIIFYS